MKALTIVFVCILLVSCTAQEEPELSQREVSSQPGVFNGTEGGPIDLAVAQSWQENWKVAQPDQPEGLFFGRQILEEMLAKEGAVGIRFYPGIDQEGKLHLLMYGTDKNGNSILTGAVQAANFSIDCPPVCSGATHAQ